MKKFIFVVRDNDLNITYTITADSIADLKTWCSDANNAQTIYKSRVILTGGERWTTHDCVTNNPVTGLIYAVRPA